MPGAKGDKGDPGRPLADMAVDVGSAEVTRWRPATSGEVYNLPTSPD